jgi:hypothetical protein
MAEWESSTVEIAAGDARKPACGGLEIGGRGDRRISEVITGVDGCVLQSMSANK